MIETNKIKILNLYACLGGNRYKWDEVAEIKVTAVELDPELARIYAANVVQMSDLWI
jgi:DNA (cytosine-5)-methyltransferase 1